jgi:hypothetical protein
VVDLTTSMEGGDGSSEVRDAMDGKILHKGGEKAEGIIDV